jgi:hypothetical protein
MWPDSPFAKPVGSFRYPVPLVAVDPDVNPDVTVCFRREWLPYIIGSLQQLLLQSTWDTNDPDALNRAQGQAQLLVSMFIQGCPQDDLPAPFIVDEMEYQMAICEQLRWENGVLQGLCCGEWTDISGTGGAGAIPGAVTQPPPTDPPATNDCLDFFVTLNGRDKWLCPFPVSAGNKISISSASGGWNDGGLTWACPTGGVYGLGICGAPLAAVGGDPIPTIAHMRLIGEVGTVGGWFDAMAGEYVVPIGVSSSQLTLQANDSNLADNQGSITFKVSICNAVSPSYSRPIDFTTETGGFLSTPRDEGTDCHSAGAYYFPGIGWLDFPCPSINASYINISRTFTAAEVDHFEITVVTDDLSAGTDIHIYTTLSGVETERYACHDCLISGSIVAGFNGPLTIDGIRIRVGTNGSTATISIHEGLIQGQGVAPI